MKKSLFFFAAAALALTACTNDDDALQTGQVQNSNRAVAFDTYTAGTTRAGDAGVMTTDKLKEFNGFGVFAFYHNDGAVYTSGAHRPDFMYNQQVTWAGGWTYSPLKFWPNETIKDSQTANGPATSTALDRLSFFAYAPYVSNGTGKTLGTNGATSKLTNAWKNDDGTGIVAITDATETSDPKVQWMVSDNPDNNVDLLWGVAPAGMAYQSVNPTNPGNPGYVEVPVGEPLKDMLKPDKDQKMKFLFQHALSRIGLTVVSAIDQIAAGDDGGKFDPNETRILIKDVKIWGDFGINGVLNLNNTTSNVARWENVSKSTSAEGSPLFTVDATNGYLNPVLRYDQTTMLAIQGGTKDITDLNDGVKTSETELMVGGPDPSKKVAEAQPTFTYGRVLYHKDGNDYVKATVTAEDVNAYTKNAGGDYILARTAGDATNLLMDGSIKYYKVTMSGPKQLFYDDIEAGEEYYTLDASNNFIYHKAAAAMPSGGESMQYYTRTNEALVEGNASNKYASDTYYTGLLPRYFMVIPSDLTPTPTAVNVKITYVVVTKDNQLVGNMSNIENAITKETSIQLENGKSYNLKLILGLTSVKLAAEVADWQLADDVEINLPKNN